MEDEDGGDSCDDNSNDGEPAESVTIDVYVLDADGEPVSGKLVTLFFSYSFLPGTHSREYTDDEGHAEFYYDSLDADSFEIYVDGQTFGPYDPEDGEGYTVNLE